MTNYKYNAFLQLVECGYLIILMTSILNLRVINMDNSIELIQSILSLIFMGFFAFFTVASFVFIHRNETKIKDED